MAWTRNGEPASSRPRIQPIPAAATEAVPCPISTTWRMPPPASRSRSAFGTISSPSFKCKGAPVPSPPLHFPRKVLATDSGDSAISLSR